MHDTEGCLSKFLKILYRPYNMLVSELMRSSLYMYKKHLCLHDSTPLTHKCKGKFAPMV
jgi:hypothetical protein